MKQYNRIIGMMYDENFSFVSSWNTANTSTGSSTSTQVKLPLFSGGTYNFVVNWGDGNSDTITVWNAAAVTHTYASSGTYTITITGTCTGWQFNNTGDRLKILSVSSWGTNFKLGTTQGNYFNGCNNLTLSSVADILDLTGTTILTNSFLGCTALTTINRLNEWNTANVTNMSGMFNGASVFNQNIGSWNTANVINMSSMFQSATAFNQNIGSWNVSAVTSFSSMFVLAVAFNNGGSSDINNWTLKTTGTINMSFMFQSATAFNQPIGSWNVSAVTNMSYMFSRSISGTSLFNQNIGSWNTANVTNMEGMFNPFSGSISFNQNIGSWNVSAVTTMQYMFRSNSTFNNGGSSDINNWIPSSVNNMSFMFNGASIFNQPIGSWNVSNVTNMSSMLLNATAFNQNIGSWNVSAVTSFTSFMGGKTAANYSTTNLDAIYNGWTNRLAIAALTTTFNTIKYTAAATEGRALLTRTNSTKSITNAVNNGSGLIRISATAHELSTGNKCFISGVLGTTEANGAWIVTVIDANTIDLQASTFTNTYTSAGTLRTGYGWTITDGGI